MENPQGREDKLSPQEVPRMTTLSFEAAPLGESEHHWDYIYGIVFPPCPSNVKSLSDYQQTLDYKSLDILNVDSFLESGLQVLLF